MSADVEPRSALAPTKGRSPFHCITCSDEGCEMTVLKIDADRMLALCAESDGSHASVEIALIDAVAVGDHLLVHAGTALVRL